MPKILIANRVFIPVDQTKERRLQRHYEHHCFVEQSCKKCPLYNKGIQRPGVLILRHGENQKVLDCENCNWGAYTGFFKSWSRVTIKGNDYYAVPSGDLQAVKSNLKVSFKGAVDLRCNIRAKYRLRFTKKLFTGKEMRNGKPAANQVQIAKDFLNSPGRTGVIKAKPRAGKTAVMTYLICKLGKQSAIFAHEKLLLNQFYKTFHNFTNVKEMEHLTGKKLVVIIRKEKDFITYKDAPVWLINYQKLISELGLKRVIAYLVKKRAVIGVDEIHRSASLKYIGLLNKLDPKHKIGVTATDNRKDGKYVLVLETLGHVVAESSVEAMTPKVFLFKTEHEPPRQWRGKMAYGKATRWLADNKDRNIGIIRQVFADLRKNKLHSIVIPVMGVAHAKLLTRLINKQAAFNNREKGEDWPEPLAEMLWGKLKDDQKEELLDRARSYKIRVVVAIVKFVRDGIDVPAWTHQYVLFPGSNAENAFQSTQRICTPFEGKPTPIIRLWNDPVDILINCVKNTYVDGYIPLNYKFGRLTKETLDDIVNTKKVGKSWVSTNKDIGAGWNHSDKPVPMIRTRG